MEKYVVNHTIDGYEKVEITDTRLTNEESITVLVLDSSTNEQLNTYYNGVLNILLSHAKLYIVVVDPEEIMAKAICNLAANYRNYNIYKVNKKSLIDTEYADSIIKREPTIDEVESYIGGDVSAYSDLSILLLGIEDLVKQGDTEGIKKFVEAHIHSITSLTNVAEYMKKMIDSSNSEELMEIIGELKEKLEEAEKKIETVEREKDTLKQNQDGVKKELERQKGEVNKLKAEAKTIKEQAAGNQVITTYSTIQTQIIKCTVPTVLYFKEVSYVPYVNTLIIQLIKALKVNKKNVKCIIYDQKSGMSASYNPLNIVGGTEFINNKNNYVVQNPMFVVVEPVQAILESILTSTSANIDVAIVYDRMRQITPIVDGNNVVKFFVINSKKEFKELHSALNIKDSRSIITRINSSIEGVTLNIPEIPGYNNVASDSAQTQRYLRLVTAGSNIRIVNEILNERAKLNVKVG